MQELRVLAFATLHMIKEYFRGILMVVQGAIRAKRACFELVPRVREKRMVPPEHPVFTQHAVEQPRSLQDITNGMRCVRMVVDDIRNVLLDLDDDDLSELAQVVTRRTLASLTV